MWIVCFQKGGQELVDGLRSCMVNALKAYRGLNDTTLPEHIVVYRDGVSDSQMTALVRSPHPCAPPLLSY